MFEICDHHHQHHTELERQWTRKAMNKGSHNSTLVCWIWLVCLNSIIQGRLRHQSLWWFFSAIQKRDAKKWINREVQSIVSLKTSLLQQCLNRNEASSLLPKSLYTLGTQVTLLLGKFWMLHRLDSTNNSDFLAPPPHSVLCFNTSCLLTFLILATHFSIKSFLWHLYPLVIFTSCSGIQME